MPEIVTVGEALIDLTQTGEDAAHVRCYAAFPGGAPANVAVAAARLGARTGFIGKVGRDAFGASIRQTLSGNGVDTAGLYGTDQALTTLAVVSVDAAGERSFAFYRTPGADTQLTAEEAVGALEAYRERPVFLHFGSVSLTSEPARSATLGGTLYLAGREAKTGALLPDATSCAMCRRLIINAGIDRVVIRRTPTEYAVVHVEDWVREDDSLPPAEACPR